MMGAAGVNLSDFVAAKGPMTVPLLKDSKEVVGENGKPAVLILRSPEMALPTPASQPDGASEAESAKGEVVDVQVLVRGLPEGASPIVAAYSKSGEGTNFAYTAQTEHLPGKGPAAEFEKRIPINSNGPDQYKFSVYNTEEPDVIKPETLVGQATTTLAALLAGAVELQLEGTDAFITLVRNGATAPAAKAADADAAEEEAGDVAVLSKASVRKSKAPAKEAAASEEAVEMLQDEDVAASEAPAKEAAPAEEAAPAADVAAPAADAAAPAADVAAPADVEAAPAEAAPAKQLDAVATEAPPAKEASLAAVSMLEG
jgi:hypothetical protein